MPDTADTAASIDISGILRGLMQQAPQETPSAPVRPVLPQGEQRRRSRDEEARPLPARMPTTTVHQGRMPVYAAVRRPRQEEIREHRTPWGTVRVRGRLGQAHADLMEAIWHCAGSVERDALDRVVVTVDPYRVRVMMGGGRGGSVYSHQRIRALLVDLMQAVVEIHVPARGLRALRHLVDSAEEVDLPGGVPGRSGPAGRERRLWRITLGEAGSALLLHDLPLHREPVALAGLRHAVSQAVARHVLSHRSRPRGGWILDGLLDAVAIPPDSMSRRNARRRLRQDAEVMQQLGIIIDGDRVQRGT